MSACLETLGGLVDRHDLPSARLLGNLDDKTALHSTLAGQYHAGQNLLALEQPGGVATDLSLARDNLAAATDAVVAADC